MKIKAILLSLLITFSSVILADFNDGLEAYNQGDYDTAFKEWLPYAEQGDAGAQYNLALVYDFGYKNNEQAFKWYRESALQGNKDAQYNLAFMYEDGLGVPKSENKAIKWYIKAAKQGVAGAQHNLAWKYDTGSGVDKDYAKALKWYKKSANQGYVKAQTNLGLMYSRGNGVKVNKHEAFKWYRKAAEQDNATAQNNLAVMYEYGTGVGKDYKQAVSWYLKAIDGDYEKAQENLKDLLLKMNDESKPIYSEAVKNYNNKSYNDAFPQFLLLALEGDAKAQTYIGVMYAKNQWIEKDYIQSVRWYRKAAEQDYAVAQYNLAVKYDTGKGVSKDKKQAVKWYKKSANQGNKSAQYNLALMYRNGEGVTKNDKKSAEWYIKAAEQGHAKSQANLGLLYDLGEGVEHNYIQAIKWYKKAANQGISTAQYNLGLMYEYGKGPNKNINEAIRWYQKAADQGDEDAKAKIKKLVALQGIEVMPTLKEARDEYDAGEYDSAFPKFLKLAIEGSIKAQSYVGWMYGEGLGVERDYVKSVKWYRKGAKQGDVWSQTNLGWSYHTGNGVLKNYKEAVKWYRKAADKGDEVAQFNMGLMYQKGKGVDQDIDTAIEWFRKSANQGDEKAKSKLKELLALQGNKDTSYTIFSGSGTGFLVSKNGVFATNQHVIDGCGRIVVDEKDAKLVLQDKTNDLALIKVDKTYDKVSRLSYRSPSLGSDVSVFGYPLSDMMSEKHISLTKGSVSSLAGMDGNLSNFRFTAPVQPGNSGGPIVNKKGKVVGVTRAVLGKTTLEKGDFLPQNVNFGIRSSLLISMMESKMIPVNDDPLKAENVVKHYVETTKYIKCYE